MCTPGQFMGRSSQVLFVATQKKYVYAPSSLGCCQLTVKGFPGRRARSPDSRRRSPPCVNTDPRRHTSHNRGRPVPGIHYSSVPPNSFAAPHGRPEKEGEKKTDKRRNRGTRSHLCVCVSIHICMCIFIFLRCMCVNVHLTPLTSAYLVGSCQA